MGLLDGLLGGQQMAPEDSMTLAAGLLSGRGNVFANLGQGLLGMQQERMRRQQEERAAQQAELQRALMQLQVQQGQRTQSQQDAMDEAAKRAFVPGQPQMLPTDQEVPSGPAGPGRFNLPGFAAELMKIDPMKGLAFQQSLAKESQFGKVNPADYTPESVAAFQRSAATTGQPDFSILRPRVKKEVVGGVAIDPYAIQPGATVAGPQSDVIPDGRGGFQFNPAKINPLERARVGMEGQRLANDNTRLFFDTGMGARGGGGNGVAGLPQLGQPQAGQLPPGLTPKDASGVQADLAKKQAEFQLTQKQQLPDLEATTQHTVKLVDELINHPGFSSTVGMKSPAGALAASGYAIPGTDTADFIARRNQLLGTQFMQAYQTLKGGGQITEVEGKKATDAISRMNTAQSEKEFISAAQDFKSVLQAGLARARQKAGVAGPAAGGFRFLGKE